MQETALKIRMYAEERLIAGGYRAFSFRDIADAVGIKSASVHYHFPTKESLANAVMTDYRERMLAAIGDPWADEPADRLALFVTAYRDAAGSGAVCLGGVLGSVIEDLPESTAETVKLYFVEITDWLGVVYGRLGGSTSTDSNADKAKRLLALVQGALLVARTSGDSADYDAITSRIPR